MSTMLSFLFWRPFRKLRVRKMKSQNLTTKRGLPAQIDQRKPELREAEMGSVSNLWAGKLPIDILLEVVSHLEHNGDTPIDMEGRNVGPPCWTNLARVCRKWHHDLTPYIYRALYPFTLNSCHLLLRTFTNDPALGALVAALSFPEHPGLYTGVNKDTKPGIILQLIRCCPNLVDIRIPVDNSLTWTGDNIHTIVSSNLPHLSALVNVTGLHLAAFGHRSQDVHLILDVWLSMAATLPCIERITLSFIGSFTPVKWPRMPRLHSVKIFRPRCTIQKKIPHREAISNLLINLNPAPKTLHISGLLEDFHGPPQASPFNTIHQGFLSACLSATYTVNLMDTLENLVLLYPMTRELAFRDEYLSWANGDLAHVSALRRLEISCSLFHRNLLSKPPSRFEELVITITDLGGSPKLDVVETLKSLPATMTALILKLNGCSEGDAWIHLAHKHYAAVGALSTVKEGIAKHAEIFKKEIFQLVGQTHLSFKLTAENGNWNFSFSRKAL